MANNWRDIYDVVTNDLIPTPHYFSVYGKKGEASFSKNNPGAAREWEGNSKISDCALSAGTFVGLGSTGSLRFYGMGMYLTTIRVGGGNHFRNLTLKPVDPNATSMSISGGGYYRNVLFGAGISVNYSNGLIANCVFTGSVSGTYRANNNTYLGISSFATLPPYSPSSLFHRCNIPITNLDSSNIYLAFSNCSYKIGNESSYTPLATSSGTVDELKTEFVRRCNAAGLSTNTAKLAQWVFSNTSCNNNGEVLSESEIHLFGQSKGIYIGHSQPIETVAIKGLLSEESFNDKQGETTNGITVIDDLIYTDESTVGRKGLYTKESSLIFLNDELSITSFDIAHNLPTENGVMPSVSDLLVAATTSGIKAGFNYVVRSAVDGIEAVIQYDGSLYSSMLDNNNVLIKGNIFRGVDGVSSLTITSGTPQIYRVVDLACAPVLAVRFRKNFIRSGITGGNLTPNYWYVVQATDANKSGTVTYNGVTYRHRMSFLATSSTSFTTTNANLAQAIDASQKYVKVVSVNPLIVLKDFNTYEILTGSDGELVGSAHPDFDAITSGISGVRPPVVPPFGTFFQMKVGINK
ncbi:hypothetical protein [Dysgonomonas sp. ZJ709]|uniref:hypothetical protein n=1 Tax=Dysgonomonas sp. ZJ709 TaxID=2709797 RepID=UPI0013EC1C72|nr:hypothetical protein [Dysgonomonas sp. ZJ709]